jgi:glycosyltransferase involved in cell wall biosynthesis
MTTPDAAMSRRPSISVVIPTFQRCRSVRRALESLARQTVPADQYEVIVSIDGSRDGTREMVARFSAPYALIGLWQENQGRASACNAGVRAARGDLIILLDDDMEAAPGLLAGHLSLHPEGSRRAVVGAAPIVADRSSPPLVQYQATWFNRRQERFAQPGYTLRFRDAYSGNFSARRQLLLDVGIFDPGFKVYGHEDYELALRLHRAGVELLFGRDAMAYQHFEKDFAGLARDNISRGRTAVVFARKHADVIGELKLSTYRRASRKWQRVRACLLALSRVMPATPRGVIGVMRWLESRRGGRLGRYYARSLDYFYWLGVQAALRERPPHGLTIGAGAVEPVASAAAGASDHPSSTR